MTSFIQTLGDSMKGCTGCANKRSPHKQLGQGDRVGNTLSHGPTDAIDISDEALEESEALINLIETAITRRKEKLKEAGVDDGTSNVDMAQLQEVEQRLGKAGAPGSKLTAGIAGAAAGVLGAAVAGGSAVAGEAAKAAGATKVGEKVAANGKAVANAVAAAGGAAEPSTKPADPQPAPAAAAPPEAPPAAPPAAAGEQAECALPSLFPIPSHHHRPPTLPRTALRRAAPRRTAPRRTAPCSIAPPRTAPPCSARLDAHAPHALRR